MKDWLTVIIVLLIIGVVLHGIRQMRVARREGIRLSRNARKADKQFKNEAGINSEFPSGGARVIGYRDPDQAAGLNQSLRENFEATRVTAGAPNRIPEQVTLNLDEAVPMLMESVADSTPEPEVTNKENEVLDKPVQDAVHQERDPLFEKIAPQHQTIDKQVVSAEELREPNIGDLSNLDEPVKSTDPLLEKEVHREDELEPEEVIIINVMAPAGQRFDGVSLTNALMNAGLKYGDMSIFHLYNTHSEIIFSLANMVVPGTFNLAEMENFETPGLSLFLSLPTTVESLDAFDKLVSVAKQLSEELDGELKDENRSVMTQQTIEHGRQRVMEFERRKRLAHA